MNRGEHPPLRPYEHIFLLALFGGLFLYCLRGALIGALFIPSRHGGPGIELSGASAWAITAAPPLLYAGMLLRHRTLLPRLSSTLRNFAELCLLAAGIGFMALASILHDQG